MPPTPHSRPWMSFLPAEIPGTEPIRAGEGRTAYDDAAAAATRAQVEVRTLGTTEELEVAAKLFTDLWQSPFSAHLLRAFELSGNYVAGAFDDSHRLVGASLAFAAVGAEPELHSHVTAVATSKRRSGAGLALKLHQRAWALERGIAVITWTFDPLVKRNAVFNLARLGATADRYLENIYGDMDDAINKSDESDRLWACWRLADPRVETVLRGSSARVAAPAGFEALRCSPAGLPVVSAGSATADGTLICGVPEDIETLRSTDPALAAAWRRALRQVMGGTLGRGGCLLGVNDDGDYVLRELAEGP